MILILEAAALFTIAGTVLIATMKEMTNKLEYLLNLRMAMVSELEEPPFRH